MRTNERDNLVAAIERFLTYRKELQEAYVEYVDAVPLTGKLHESYTALNLQWHERCGILAVNIDQHATEILDWLKSMDTESSMNILDFLDKHLSPLMDDSNEDH